MHLGFQKYTHKKKTVCMNVLHEYVKIARSVRVAHTKDVNELVKSTTKYSLYTDCTIARISFPNNVLCLRYVDLHKPALNQFLYGRQVWVML